VAVVGEVTRAPAPSTSNLRKHDRLMRMLAARHPALLPARFGTRFQDVDELVTVLRSREASLRRLLRHVRNRSQMTIRIAAARRRQASGRTAQGSDSRPQSSTGADYLRRRAVESDPTRELPGFDAIRGAVRRWVRDERAEHHGNIISVYHLIPRRSADAYRRALDRAAAGAGARLLVTGPMPVYAFAN
jgi:hypothetical protein